MNPDENMDVGIDVDEIVHAATDTIRKHGGDYVPFFCWNCGKKIVGGPFPCSRCGAVTVGKLRYLSPHAPHHPGIASALHPSVVRYRIKAILGTLIFCLLFSAGLSIYMFASGELDLYNGGAWVMAAILGVLWLFWLLWMVWEYGGSGRKRGTCASFAGCVTTTPTGGQTTAADAAAFWQNREMMGKWPER